MTATRKRRGAWDDPVRYVSPFGSPATMERTEAERYLAEDDALWLDFQELGLLTERQREIGPPRMEEVPR